MRIIKSHTGVSIQVAGSRWSITQSPMPANRKRLQRYGAIWFAVTGVRVGWDAAISVTLPPPVSGDVEIKDNGEKKQPGVTRMRSKISSKAHAPGVTVYYGSNAAWPIRIPWMYRCEYLYIDTYNKQCYSRSITSRGSKIQSWCVCMSMPASVYLCVCVCIIQQKSFTRLLKDLLLICYK